MFVGASNVLPEDESLNALLDRFLIRIKCDYVEPDLLHQVLIAGWKLEGAATKEVPTILADDIRELQLLCRKIDLTGIRNEYVDIIHSLRNTGIKVSDRRAVKLQNLIAASALMCGRTEAIVSDFWVLKYIWDNEEQIEILEGIINKIIEKDHSDAAHPQALYNKTPDAESVMKEVQYLTEKWQDDALSFEEQNVIKDKLRYIQTRCDWIKDGEQKKYIQEHIESLWQKILQTI